jgi:hypothetical protein
MIVQNGHSLQSKCEVRKWKHVIRDFSIPLSGYQFSMWHVTSPDQGLSSKRGKSLGTRLHKHVLFKHSCIVIYISQTFSFTNRNILILRKELCDLRRFSARRNFFYRNEIFFGLTSRQMELIRNRLNLNNRNFGSIEKFRLVENRLYLKWVPCC